MSISWLSLDYICGFLSLESVFVTQPRTFENKQLQTVRDIEEICHLITCKALILFLSDSFSVCQILPPCQTGDISPRVFSQPL